MNDKGNKLSIKYCSNCVLPATFPGIRLNDTGICNYCLEYKGIDYQRMVKSEYYQRFETLIKEHKGRSSYDVLMCFSGGKDSTHTLAILKNKYNLNILAMSFDNGFVPDQTIKNIRNVVEALEVDHVFIKPKFDMLAKIFRHCASNDIFPPKALERASTICNSCMGMIKYSALRMALEKDIPLIAYGWSPGQAPIASSIMKNNPTMVKKMQKTLLDPLFLIVGSEIEPYFLQEKHFDDRYHFPYNVHPLAFLNYDEKEIYKNISDFGWKAPERVDSNSTNCFLNSFANYVHKEKCGFHPYAFELATLVREGNMDRMTALKRLNQQETPEIVAMVQKKLAIKR